jgi:peptide/nickel transport system substrate-binding protein
VEGPGETRQLAAALLCAALSTAIPLRAGTAGQRVLRIASLGPRSLNPLLSQSTTENGLGPIAFDLLVEVDDRHRAIPRLAARVPTRENGDISKDGLSITYHLRRDVKWHDGAPFTSKDVAFSWAAIMNPKNNVISRRGYDLVRRVDTPDAYTAIFRLKKAFAPAVLTLFSESDQPYRIVPEHILGKLPDINRADFNQHPIGTGPFKFLRWDRGNQIEYVANPEYYLGRPKLDRIVVKEIPDQNTQVVQMKSHAVDFMVAGSAAYRDLRGASGIELQLTPVNGYVAVMLNLQSSKLKDVAVRRALAGAIDAKAITEEVSYGTGTPATGDLPSFVWAYNPHVRRYPFDPAAARKTLAPRHLSLVLIESLGTETTRQIDVLVQSMLQNAGVSVEIRPYAPQLFLAPATAGGPLRAGKFDLASWAWIAGADPDDSSQFTCNMTPPNGYNFMHYCDPAVDEAEKIAVSSYDPAIRKRAYDTIQSRIANDVPMVFLYWLKYRLAYASDLHGVRNNGITETWNINEWSRSP